MEHQLNPKDKQILGAAMQRAQTIVEIICLQNDLSGPWMPSPDGLSLIPAEQPIATATGAK